VEGKSRRSGDGGHSFGFREREAKGITREASGLSVNSVFFLLFFLNKKIVIKSSDAL
jgi:hypothetical protein